MTHKSDRIDFELENGTPGVAMIVIIPLADGRTLVTCANEDEETDAPVNMAVEDLFGIVCRRHGLDPAKVVWVEYSTDILTIPNSGEVGDWELVTWEDGPGNGPQWRQMTPKDWQELGTTPPPGPRDLPRPRA